MFYKKVVLRNFTKFKGKHVCQSLFFNKVADLMPATLLKESSWHRFFSVKFLRPTFLQNTSGGCFFIWWGHKHELKHSYCIYTLHLFFACFMILKSIGLLIKFFLTTNSEKCNFNFLKKVQVPLTIRKNIKLIKFSRLTFKSLKTQKTISN